MNENANSKMPKDLIKYLDSRVTGLSKYKILTYAKKGLKRYKIGRMFYVSTEELKFFIINDPLLK